MSDRQIDDVTFYELTRNQIEHEDRLIDHRMTWLLTLQAFLFGAFGFSLSAESNLQSTKRLNPSFDITAATGFIHHARVGFALMTFASSAVLLCGVAAAAMSMRNLVGQWDNRQLIDRGKYPQIIGRDVPLLGIYGGLLPTYLLPVASSAVWLWFEQDEKLVQWGFGVVAAFAIIGLVPVVVFHAGKQASRR